VFEFFAQSFAPSLGTFVLTFLHNPLWFSIFIGPVLALLYTELLRYKLIRGAGQRVQLCFNGKSLNWRQCYALVVAGTLSHFFYEILFEENGTTPIYQWILSTGYWEHIDNPAADYIVWIMFIIVLGALCVGFLFLHSEFYVATPAKRLLRTVQLLVCVCFAYCLYLYVRVYLVKPRQPAVGEEADLGVLVFTGVFVFLPLLLCLWSCGCLNSQGYGTGNGEGILIA